MDAEDHTQSHQNTTIEKPIQVLFMCSGNTCRSPMAAAIAQKQLDEKFPGKFVCESAGAAIDETKERETISPEGVQALKENGFGSVDLERKARTPEDVGIEGFDKVYVLAVKHIDKLKAKFPEMADKIEPYTLGPIPDPYDLEHFPYDWPHKSDPDVRTSGERQKDYSYVAQKIDRALSPKIVEALEKEFIQTSQTAEIGTTR